jgi:hypothetical protein
MKELEKLVKRLEPRLALLLVNAGTALSLSGLIVQLIKLVCEGRAAPL